MENKLVDSYPFQLL